MSITINDKRGNDSPLSWEDLVVGETYTYDNHYLIMTDEDRAVDLSSGVTYTGIDVRTGLQFHKFKARLEIE